MYVILTSKPGLFRTELVDGLRPLQAYDYLFYGVKKATFTIAELTNEDIKVKVIDEGWVPQIVNDVPSKFLEKFDTPEMAFQELEHLTTFGHMDTALRKA